jgi:hypothetical protein
LTRAWLPVSLMAVSCLAASPEERGLAYLAQEVPRWSSENHCFSCHNNGDGARVLYIATSRGYRVPRPALADTTRWLLDPASWDGNRGNPAFSDKKLARIQFAASLAEAYKTGAIHDRSAVIAAAESLTPYQEADGSWQVDAGAAVGSPATWGPVLATYMARKTLEVAGADRFAKPIARANQWLRENQPRSILDTSAKMLALQTSEPLAFILAAQTRDGGWGTYPGSPPDVFDTAMALLALQDAKQPARTRDAIKRGRAFLISLQQSSGGWPETTRPAGAQSYAQHISTSAWATLALVGQAFLPAADFSRPPR